MKRHIFVKFSCCLLGALIFPLFLPVCAAQVYSIKKLPTLGGKARPWFPNLAYGINSSGQVTGCSPLNDLYYYDIFLWTPVAGMQDLGVECSPGEGYNYPGGLNDLAHLTSITDNHGNAEGFLWSAPGGFQDLGTWVFPAGVNNLDQVTGGYVYNYPYRHAFFWTSEKGLQDLGTLGGNESYAHGVNDAGQVVGWSDTRNGYEAFLWSESTGMQAIPSLYSANAINNQGMVAAYATSGHAAVWTQAGGTEDLGVLPATSASYAVALNNRGAVVGNSWPQNSRVGFAFLWSSTQGMINLNALGKNKLQNWTAVGINDAGQIAVNRTDGQLLILTPIIAIAVSSSQNPSQVGQLVTFTATTSSIAGPPPDGEIITFMDSNKILGTAPLVGGSATFSTASLSAGTHKITASYPGDINYGSSQSKVLKQVVQ